MRDLDKKVGPWTFRVWGLILNFAGNAMAIYGALGVVHDGSRWPWLLVGGGLSLFCILILARPSD